MPLIWWKHAGLVERDIISPYAPGGSLDWNTIPTISDRYLQVAWVVYDRNQHPLAGSRVGLTEDLDNAAFVHQQDRT
jgi:hypothetical protein